VWTTRPSLQAPLIGRNEALYRLAQAYEQARSGHGGAVLISGEAGIGKSRLMQDFVNGLEGEATVISGGGHEAEQDLPYWPLIEALGPHLPAINWAALNVQSLHLSEVTRLFPELRTLLPNLPPPAVAEPGQEQGRLFLALTRWFLGLAAQRPPLILCLDDLHWADETTLAWLGYLGRQLKRAPVLVLGAYRGAEAARVARLRAGLLRLSVLQEVMLEGLLPVEVQRLVRRLAGQAAADGRLDRRLHRGSGGNPFFLLETLRAMLDAGSLRQGETAQDGAELPLPDTVYEAIQDRLRHLAPQTRRVLEAGVVIGQQFDLDLVQATSGLDESEVIGALESLLARQIITEYEGQYWFNHGLVRTAVYRDLGYDRRQLLHRRTAEASKAAAR
jgi:predicted ATPase